MTNGNTLILESKLKRHKIIYSNENGKIIIGKSRTDYMTLIGMVAFPIILGIGICLLLIFEDFIFFTGPNRRKIMVGTIFLFGTGFFNLSRVISKKRANNNLKTLDDKFIKIENESGEYIFESNNIQGFEYGSKQTAEEIFEGNLYLVDSNNRRHQILRFDEKNQKYLLDDLKWFAEYFAKHTELKVGIPEKI